MKNKSLSQKIISIVSLVAVVFILLLEIKFLVQINRLGAQGQTIKRPIELYSKLGVVIGFGFLSAVMVYLLNFLNFKTDKARKDFSIAVCVFVFINLLLAIIFLTTEASDFAKLFQLNDKSKRNISYYFFHIKKEFLIFVFSLVIFVNEVINFSKNKKEQIRQSHVYFLVVLATFINALFLMVSILDTKQIPEVYFDSRFKPSIISAVVFSVIGFLVSFVHIFVTIAQRRAIGNEALSNKKIKLAGIILNSVEIGAQVIALALMNSLSLLSTTNFYQTFFMLEYLFLLILLAQNQIALSAFSIDQRLVDERNKRLQDEDEMKEVFKGTI